MKEIVSINVGQAGIQLSNAAWELFCIEHGIRSDGSSVLGDLDDENEASGIFFSRVNAFFVPRVLQIDFEPTVIDEVRIGVYRNLFNPNYMISGLQDASSNFARGFFSEGKKYIANARRVIRKLIEQCDSIQGFCIMNSFDGGTGSGFTTLLEEEISIMSPKTSKFQLGIYPSNKLASSTVYPYNTILHAHYTSGYTDMCPILDNESLYYMCINKLGIEKPTFTNINRIIAQVFSNFTVSLRFENSVSNSITQLCTNLVPFPKIHFVLPHMAPVCTQAVYEKSSFEISSITSEIFFIDNQLVRCDTKNGLFMSCVLQYRGDVTPAEVNQAIYAIKQNSSIQFVDWCPTGFKVGICSRPPASPPGSGFAVTIRNVTMLSNTSAIVEIWDNLITKFDCLYSRKAFIHWFVGEGLELEELTEARNTCLQLKTDYLEICANSDTVKSNSNIKSMYVYDEDLIEIDEDFVEEENLSNSFESYC